MLAVDTNIIVRLAVTDDPEQTGIVRHLFAHSEIWISKTVLLETEWVLRYKYANTAKEIHVFFIKLLGLPNVACESNEQIAKALAWYKAGMDLADALHLASSSLAAQFITFDKDCGKKAARLKTKPRVRIAAAD